ncbi:aldo/keto reductase [Labrys monachus]|uniref:2,5-diketo-D-gluconate reductase A n=1 Tax=Labrys monachus TaxID=217067 RepID=A0ABU0FQ76_9HYPH|nr:aldo/keto reductase [Labrys monachus]MDQ0396213.1 2,5-diketo-D-gluconate reductase A [Labrys monachus]
MNSPVIRLNDGYEIPQLGFGVWQVPNAGAAAAVTAAIDAGYRLIDTAAAYRNEEGVGDAIAASPVGRDALFITTKLANPDQGYESTLRAFDASMKLLRIEKLDLYLIHWQAVHRGAYLDTWKAFVKLRDEGRIASIGVSNFTVPNLERLRDETGVMPSVNQIELHPRFQQKALRAYHAKAGIATESWSPLGQGSLIDDPQLAAIGRKYGKTAAQVILRWHLDLGLIAIPKSVTPARIVENFDLFDFRLSEEDIAAIDKLDRPDGRIGPDPEVFG